MAMACLRWKSTKCRRNQRASGSSTDPRRVFDREEFCAGTSGRQQTERRICAAKGTNGDKRLDFAEFSARPPAVGFIEIDADGDGYLDFKEFWRGTMGAASRARGADIPGRGPGP